MANKPIFPIIKPGVEVMFFLIVFIAAIGAEQYQYDSSEFMQESQQKEISE